MGSPARLEIPKAVKLEVFRRAGGPENVCCEGCGLRLGGKPFDYDHTIAEWMQNLPPSERVITASDVKLLGHCCHKPKTSREAGQRAHGKRLIEKAAGVRTSATPMKCGRASPYKRKMNGQLVWRETGEPVR
jgi:hypothetical protein